MILNSLYKDYILFEKIVNKHDPDSDYINLRHVPFIKPTTILPVFNFMNEIGINHYYPNYNTRNYLRRVFRVTKNKSTTIPIKRLPSNLKDKDKFDIIEEIRSLLTRNYVEPQSFDYLSIEIMNNISEHSKYTDAYMFAQQYPKIDITDVCFIDNGISIPVSLRNSGHSQDLDCKYVLDALNGKSSDSNKYRMRGSGLNSSQRIVAEAFGGEMLVVSGNGLCHINPKGVFIKETDNFLKGTLVSLRINENNLGQSIYEYTSYKEINKTSNLYK